MKNHKQHILSLLTMLTFALLALGSSNSKEPGTPQDTKTIKNKRPNFILSADQLVTEYRAATLANPVGADNQYKGKIAIISGSVFDIINSNSGVASIQVGSTSCVCLFTESEYADVGKLARKQDVKIKGKIVGLENGIVTLYNCSVIP